MPETVTDPVTLFPIPLSWIEQCADPGALQKIRSGRFVLLSNGELIRRGLTTGTTAAAACKGAILSLKNPIDSVSVTTPARIDVSLPVVGRNGYCIAVKDGGDHQFDITRGVEIAAQARPADRVELAIGKGIGRITAPGLCDEMGKPAISQSARRQIMAAIEGALMETGFDAVWVELGIPRGEELAEKTLNLRLGIVGGISILGSTGFVEPWNDHLIEERAEELRGAGKVVVTTGRVGLKFSRVLFPDHKAVLMGSQLDRLAFGEEQESILCGLPALILKWAWPGVLEGTGYGTVAEMVKLEPEHKNITLALEKVKKKLPNTRIVLLRKDGSILRDVP
ncbi:MAG: cobalt-precorrin-5B (C(1))-methyltransferase [Methanothrix sp.]